MSSTFRLASRASVVFVAFALLATSIILISAEGRSDDNPATDPLEQTCLAAPAITDLTAAGMAAATIGETVTFSQTVNVEEGDIYQDILDDPSGEIFYASYLEITQLDDLDPGDFLDLVSGPTLTIEGTPVVLTPGTEPDPTEFVLHALTNVAGESVWRVYFPGDVQSMLAAEPGEGQFSYSVGAGGETFVLGFDAVVVDAPAVVSGSVLDGASCYTQISSGPTNRNTDRPRVAVSIVEPLVELDKAAQAAGGFTAPGGIVTYDIVATNPGSDAAGTTMYSTAYDVVLVDTLDPSLTPVDASGNPILDGATTASGAVYNAVANTLTWDPAGDIAPGGQLAVSYDVLVVEGLAGGETLDNVVVADWNSLPPEEGDGRLVEDGASADETVTIGTAEPTVTKSGSYLLDGAEVNFDSETNGGPLPAGVDFTQTVTVELAPDSVHFNATVHDIIPDGLTFVSFDSATCEIGAAGPGSCTAPIGQTRTPQEFASGTTPILWYIGNVTTGPDPITYTFTYTVRIDDSYAIAGPVATGDLLTNLAEPAARLGAVTAAHSDLVEDGGPSGEELLTVTVELGRVRQDIERALPQCRAALDEILPAVGSLESEREEGRVVPQPAPSLEDVLVDQHGIDADAAECAAGEIDARPDADIDDVAVLAALSVCLNS